MLNLAIECSGIAGSVALFEGGLLLTEISLPSEVGSVRSLAATIETVLKKWVWDAARRVELISVTHGPGSFTGLRVGLATAQMLGLAWSLPIAPVDTLAVIALQASGRHCQPTEHYSRSMVGIVPVINAFRRQVFVGGWCADGQSPGGIAGSQDAAELCQLVPAQVVDAAVWQAQPWASLSPSQSPPSQVLVCGPGLRTYLPQSQPGVQLADADCWDPTASCVGRLGWEVFQRGQAVKAHTLRPNYVRSSAAEEMRSSCPTDSIPK